MSSDKGDLFDAKDVLPARPPVSATEWKGISFFSIHLPLVEGSFVHILQPGESNEVALMIQIPRLVAIINQCGGGNMRNERHFFFSLSQALLKHKLKLSHGIRDLIVKNWLSWFNCPDGTSCVISAVHECLMHMLTEVRFYCIFCTTRADLGLQVILNAVNEANRCSYLFIFCSGLQWETKSCPETSFSVWQKKLSKQQILVVMTSPSHLPTIG